MKRTVNRATRRDDGFTLMELLVVITIIGILSSMLLGALHSASETAKRANTKSLIMRLHNQIMTMYESYESRRLPIKPAQGIQQTADQNNTIASHGFRQRVARRKLLATRELMRMEMPDRYEDLEFDPKWLTLGESDAATPVTPYLKSAYMQRIRLSDTRRPLDQVLDYVKRVNGPAECLYLIINVAVQDPGLLQQYSAADIGDTDSDGMPEFIDAWGRPIEWIRWPAGFESEYMPMFRVHKSFVLQTDPPKTASQLFHGDQPKDPNDDEYYLTRDPVNRPDPFNPLEVGPTEDRRHWQPGDSPPEFGCSITPLIFSSGPNGAQGIFFHGSDRENYKFSPSNDASDPFNTYEDSQGVERYLGEVLPDGLHYDNIYNHLISTQQ